MTIKEKFELDNELEWNYAGPTIHALEGFAHVNTNIIDIDRPKGTWLLKGVWTNSFEAEQHILHYGYTHDPVCWMLVGYAGGYRSACLGQKVIYKEVNCVGKGDEHCTFIGKTIEEWGEEIVPELAYYEVSKISEELEAAHHRITIQNGILERIITIHERLTQCILKGKGVEAIIASLAELMKCTVILEDRHLVPQSSSFLEQPDTKDLLTPYHSIWTNPSFKKSSAFYLQQKRPFQIIGQYSDIQVYRLVSPILVGSELLGFVSLLRSEQSFSELENIALEQAASVFALKILEEKKINAVERRLMGDFVDDLLSGNFPDPSSIIKRALGLNYDITLPHRVLMLDIDNFTQLLNSFPRNGKRILQFKTDFFNTVQSCLEHLGKGMVVKKSDNLIMLVQLDKPDSPEKGCRQIAEKIIEQISRQFPKVTLTVGIGSSCKELSDFHHSFLSAQKAIEIGKALKKQGQVISLEQFGTHALLFSALNPSDLLHFATSQIGSLVTYDETYQAQLIPTLQKFLSNRGSVEETSKTMNMSISGLKYRLHRIEEITGQDPKDFQACLNFQLALNILQLAGQDKFKL
jgi:sugar diacid utilization regulator